MKLNWDIHELIEFGERIVDVDKFNDFMEDATKEIAKILHKMLITNTPVKTGTLKAFWQTEENYSYTVKKVDNGFEVELVNRAVYASSVNDGHYSHNQFNKGGQPYEVKHRTVPYTQGNSASTFVFGHFFVESTILQLENGRQLESLIRKQLKRWFRWCVNG